jgi:hypothetical protein
LTLDSTNVFEDSNWIARYGVTSNGGRRIILNVQSGMQGGVISKWIEGQKEVVCEFDLHKYCR